jgi:hypothetical protein
VQVCLPDARITGERADSVFICLQLSNQTAVRRAEIFVDGAEKARDFSTLTQACPVFAKFAPPLPGFLALPGMRLGAASRTDSALMVR